MGNVILTNSNGKVFVIEGALNLRRRTTQTTTQISFPLQSSNKALLNNLFGQKAQLTCSFTILERDDDYTQGTGSPGSAPYSIKDQKNYIEEFIFTPGNEMELIDNEGNTFEGRISELEFESLGDDPLSDSATFTFLVGTFAI